MSKDQAADLAVFNLARFADLERAALWLGVARYTPDSVRRFLEGQMQASLALPRAKGNLLRYKIKVGFDCLNAGDLAGATIVALELQIMTIRLEAARQGGHGRAKIADREDAIARATDLWRRVPILSAFEVARRIRRTWLQAASADDPPHKIPSVHTIRQWIALLSPRRNGKP
jgi:hypothetical protein